MCIVLSVYIFLKLNCVSFYQRVTNKSAKSNIMREENRGIRTHGGLVVAKLRFMPRRVQQWSSEEREAAPTQARSCMGERARMRDFRRSALASWGGDSWVCCRDSKLLVFNRRGRFCRKWKRLSIPPTLFFKK